MREVAEYLKYKPKKRSVKFSYSSSASLSRIGVLGNDTPHTRHMYKTTEWPNPTYSEAPSQRLRLPANQPEERAERTCDFMM